MVLAYVIGGVLALAILCLVLYWQLAVAEGAYLGRRVVILLYDWFAPRYDKVKGYYPQLDALMLAAPILQHTRHLVANHVQVLDVATGTGRLPQVLLTARSFKGHITALDLSARMLAQGQTKLAAYADRITWIRHDAQNLPFPDESFEVVTCLESMEFLPHPIEAVREMIRVLKPGGMLMISNRIGPDAWKLPGRAIPTPAFATQLELVGLHDVKIEAWLVDYDLLRAIK